jgi:hypothetical protein
MSSARGWLLASAVLGVVVPALAASAIARHPELRDTTMAAMAARAGSSLTFRDAGETCAWMEMAASGCMLRYDPSRREFYRLSANRLARIFEGADPGAFSIEQPANFELGVNVRVARAPDVAPPPALLPRADEAIE